MYYLDYYYPITRVRDNISVFSEPLGEEINGKGYECLGSVFWQPKLFDKKSSHYAVDWIYRLEHHINDIFFILRIAEQLKQFSKFFHFPPKLPEISTRYFQYGNSLVTIFLFFYFYAVT